MVTKICSSSHEAREFEMRVALLALLYSLTASAPASNTSSQTMQTLRTEQQTAHIVIGYQEGGRLAYIDTTSGDAFKEIETPASEPGPQGLELKGAAGVLTSPDGHWSASCATRSDCTVSLKGDSKKSFSVSRKRTLTPLYFSPDSSFAFLVEKAPNWRFPLRCSFEDERDVVVYDTNTGARSVLTTVCGGFPYGSLRWYELGAQ
jgi:hypothetical protein